MAFQGNLSDFSLPDILQLIAAQEKIGHLVLRHGDETLTVGFTAGLVVDADSTARHLVDRLARVLEKSGLASREEIAQALIIGRGRAARVARVLINKGLVKP